MKSTKYTAADLQILHDMTLVLKEQCDLSIPIEFNFRKVSYNLEDGTIHFYQNMYSSRKKYLGILGVASKHNLKTSEDYLDD